MTPTWADNPRRTFSPTRRLPHFAKRFEASGMGVRNDDSDLLSWRGTPQHFIKRFHLSARASEACMKSASVGTVDVDVRRSIVRRTIRVCRPMLVANNVVRPNRECAPTNFLVAIGDLRTHGLRSLAHRRGPDVPTGKRETSTANAPAGQPCDRRPAVLRLITVVQNNPRGGRAAGGYPKRLCRRGRVSHDTTPRTPGRNKKTTSTTVNGISRSHTNASVAPSALVKADSCLAFGQPPCGLGSNGPLSRPAHRPGQKPKSMPPMTTGAGMQTTLCLCSLPRAACERNTNANDAS